MPTTVSPSAGVLDDATDSEIFPTPSDGPPREETPPAALDSPDAEELRQMAGNGDEEALRELIKLTENPQWKTRWDAVNALGLLEEPSAVPALIERALRDENSHPRWRSLWAIAQIDRAGAAAIPALLEALESGDPVIVRNAAVALAFFKRPEARPEITRGLHDADEYRRWEAVFSLRNIAGKAEVESLIPLLDEDIETSVRVRGETALTLGRVGDGTAVEPLIATLRNDSSSQVRWRAAAALARLRDPSIVVELERALSDEQDEQVLEAIQKAIDAIEKR